VIWGEVQALNFLSERQTEDGGESPPEEWGKGTRQEQLSWWIDLERGDGATSAAPA